MKSLFFMKRGARFRSGSWSLLVCLGLLAGCRESSQAGPGGGVPPAGGREIAPGVTYTNENLPAGPWSIHVVRARRDGGEFGLVSVHARRAAIGMATLSQQVRSVPASTGTPVAALNGDFYQRDRSYAGDPRGLQIVDGEMISAPVGGVALWIDGAGEPHATNIAPALSISWGAGTTQRIGLNEEREPSEVVLYTPAVGNGTRTSGGREWILGFEGGTNAPLGTRAGTKVALRVLEVRDGGNAPLAPGRWVVSAGQGVVRRNPGLAAVPVGGTIEVTLGTEPSLAGASQAISGGPVLVRGGKALKIVPPRSDSYEFSSMSQRHPRSAIGWSRTHWVMVEVDGRQPGLSVGMTLEELGATMARWGCEEAMNLDGGGSATFWAGGRIVNSPCDGSERPIANSVVLVRRPQGGGPGRN